MCANQRKVWLGWVESPGVFVVVVARLCFPAVSLCFYTFCVLFQENPDAVERETRVLRLQNLKAVSSHFFFSSSSCFLLFHSPYGVHVMSCIVSESFGACC